MTYRVVLTARARRDISERLPEAVAAACIEFLASVLAENPHRVGKPLRARMAGLHAARRGEFRIIYSIDESEVTVLGVSIQHRRDVYRP